MAAVNDDDSKERERLYDDLYQKYGRPLEGAHKGEYLAVSPNGQTIIGRTLLEVAQRATSTFGPGNYIFKIGEPAVGKWR